MQVLFLLTLVTQQQKALRRVAVFTIILKHPSIYYNKFK